MKKEEVFIGIIFAILLAIGVYYVVSVRGSIESPQLKIQREILEEVKDK